MRLIFGNYTEVKVVRLLLCSKLTKEMTHYKKPQKNFQNVETLFTFHANHQQNGFI